MVLPQRKRPISARWVFKLKLGHVNQPPRYKARLVACAFEQKEGVDYKETLASFVKWETIRLVSGIATHARWPLRHLDVEIAFFNGILKEEVYLIQSQGFVVGGQEKLVC